MIIKRCLVVDDSEETSYALTSVLSTFPFLETFVARSFESALEFLLNKSMDLVFLDVDLEGKNGLNILKFLTTVPPTIVISSSPEYAVDAYDTENIIGFLKKPLDYEQVTAKVSNVLALKAVKSGYISKDYCLLKVGTKITRIDYTTIDYIEGYGMYCKIHCENKVFISSESMNTIMSSFPTATFMRIHKSYIVNIQKITKINHKVCIINSKSIPIGNTYKSEVQPLLKIFKNI